MNVPKLLHSFLLALIFLGVLMMSPFTAKATEPKQNAYDFTFHALQGAGNLPLSQFRGKVILVVNTASQCGFTGQYDGLEKLYETYASEGLVVVGVPSNDFGKQEPGSDKEIASFCKLNYGVSFPMASKEIVTGSHAHPFYLWARGQLGYLAAPKWNFHKYLINRRGELVDSFYSTTKPDSETLLHAIREQLDDKVIDSPNP